MGKPQGNRNTANKSTPCTIFMFWKDAQTRSLFKILKKCIFRLSQQPAIPTQTNTAVAKTYTSWDWDAMWTSSDECVHNLGLLSFFLSFFLSLFPSRSLFLSLCRFCGEFPSNNVICWRGYLAITLISDNLAITICCTRFPGQAIAPCPQL